MAYHIDEQARAEALDLITYVAHVTLTPRRWRDADAALDAMHSAVEAGDGTAFQTARDALDRAVPTRVLRVRKPPDPATVPATQQTRERINSLVHRLESSNDQTRDSATNTSIADGAKPSR